MITEEKPMQSGQLIPQASVASIGWTYWLITNAGSSAVGAAATAATDTFLKSLVNPTITGTAIVVGYASSLLFTAGISVACWSVSTAASGVSSLWQRATAPTESAESRRDGNLGFY